MSDLLVIVKTVIVLAAWWVLRAVVLAIPVLGIVLLAFPSLHAELNTSEWSRFAAFSAWVTNNYIEVTVFIIFLYALSLQRKVSRIEDTLGKHDLIMGGILNYIDAQPEYPDQEKILRRSMADTLKEMWKVYPKMFYPFYGAALKDFYRNQVFNTKLTRNGIPITIRDDIKANERV